MQKALLYIGVSIDADRLRGQPRRGDVMSRENTRSRAYGLCPFHGISHQLLISVPTPHYVPRDIDIDIYPQCINGNMLPR